MSITLYDAREDQLKRLNVSTDYAPCTTYDQFFRLSQTEDHGKKVLRFSGEILPQDKEYCFCDPVKGTYNILNGLPEIHARNNEKARTYEMKRKNKVVFEKVVPLPYELIGKDKSGVYCVWNYMHDACNTQGRIMASHRREMGITDIMGKTKLSRSTVSRALDILDDAGLVRGYKGRENKKTVIYRVSPLYRPVPAGKTGRKIDWIDWLLFHDELTPYVAGNDISTSFAYSELNCLTYYKLFPEELAALPREADIAAAVAAPAESEDLFDLEAPVDVPQEMEESVLDELARRPYEPTSPEVAALIDSLDFSALEKEQQEPAAPVKLSTFDDGLDDKDLRDKIFRETVLRRAHEKYITFDPRCTTLTEIDPDRDMYISVNTNMFRDGKLSDSEVDHVRAWFVDIDGGKDAEGKYYTGLELAQRKAQMRDVISVLPAPTAIVETRNGYHVYWSVDEAESEDIANWKVVENEIHKYVNIMDDKVKDISRVLRAPGSNWVKADAGLPKFPVEVVYATGTAYAAKDLLDAFACANETISAHVRAYNAKYPKPEKNTRTEKKASTPKAAKVSAPKVVVKPGAYSPIADADLTILEKIRKGIVIPFGDNQGKPAKVVDSLYDAIKRVDIGAFLGIDNPHHFRDILHIDNNPSAYIARDNNNPDHYLYCCASASSPASSGWDLANIVEFIQNTDKKHARRYLAKCLNIKGRAKKLQKVG